MKGLLQINASVVTSILLTGAILKLAGDGMFGTQVQKMAAFITKGYGV